HIVWSPCGPNAGSKLSHNIPEHLFFDPRYFFPDLFQSEQKQIPPIRSSAFELGAALGHGRTANPLDVVLGIRVMLRNRRLEHGRASATVLTFPVTSPFPILTSIPPSQSQPICRW